jgi:hypothetical protein
MEPVLENRTYRRIFHEFGGAGVRKYQLGRVRLLGF